MNVEWAGPNLSLATLAKELTARFGAPKRLYEFVTGYKSASNVSGHNADNNGRGHSMDIFVGAGQSISVEQGIDLAERLRLEGKKGSIPGHPDRLAYIIHRGRIAGDHTNWEWVPYYGIADHYDHIHVSSVFDYYWGDPVAGNPLDYNSTLAWNLWGTTSGQGGDITPIEEDDFMATMTDGEKARLLAAADRINGTIPDRRHTNGAVVKVAMEDNTFSKADGAYQNTITQRDMVPALGRIETSLGTKPDKADLAAAILAGGNGDPELIAKAVIDAVGEGLAQDVVEALGNALVGSK